MMIVGVMGVRVCKVPLLRCSDAAGGIILVAIIHLYLCCCTSHVFCTFTPIVLVGEAAVCRPVETFPPVATWTVVGNLHHITGFFQAQIVGALCHYVECRKTMDWIMPIYCIPQLLMVITQVAGPHFRVPMSLRPEVCETHIVTCLNVLEPHVARPSTELPVAAQIERIRSVAEHHKHEDVGRRPALLSSCAHVFRFTYSANHED